MAATIQRRCLHCDHAVADDSMDPSQQLANAARGDDHRICVCNPPTATLITSDRGIIPVNAYPIVNGKSLSCDQWKPRKVTLVPGGRDGNAA